MNVGGITLYPFILYPYDPPISIRVHEFVHVHQVETLGWFKFYFDYLWQYFNLRLKGENNWDAYNHISYEQEAFDLQYDFEAWYYNLPDSDKDLVQAMHPESFASSFYFDKPEEKHPDA